MTPRQSTGAIESGKHAGGSDEATHHRVVETVALVHFDTSPGPLVGGGERTRTADFYRITSEPRCTGRPVRPRPARRRSRTTPRPCRRSHSCPKAAPPARDCAVEIVDDAGDADAALVARDEVGLRVRRLRQVEPAHGKRISGGIDRALQVYGTRVRRIRSRRRAGRFNHDRGRDHADDHCDAGEACSDNGFVSARTYMLH